MANQSFTMLGKLNDLTGKYREHGTEIDRLNRMEEELKSEYDRIVASGDMTDEAQINKASGTQVKIAMIPHKRLQHQKAREALIEPIRTEAKLVRHVLQSAGEKISSAAVDRLKPIVKSIVPSNEVDRCAGAILSFTDAATPITEAVSAVPNPNTLPENPLELAQDLLSVHRGLVDCLERFASSFPEGFNPFPETEEAFLQMVPENYRPGYKPFDHKAAGHVWVQEVSKWMAPKEADAFYRRPVMPGVPNAK
jgi:hypothetical protein